ncbi:unnamed protein product, partial [Phaeothamnion confervicola]
GAAAAPAAAAQDGDVVLKAGASLIAIEEYNAKWNDLPLSGGFRCRVQTVPAVAAACEHLSRQNFAVVAAGSVEGITKVYACARNVAAAVNAGGGAATGCLFLAELAFDGGSSELTTRFKCEEPRLTARFVRHLRLRAVVGDHMPLP